MRFSARGFPPVRQARQRTLHELAVVAAVVKGAPNPKSTAERYYDCQTVEAARDAEAYEDAHEGLGTSRSTPQSSLLSGPLATRRWPGTARPSTVTTDAQRT